MNSFIQNQFNKEILAEQKLKKAHSGAFKFKSKG